jgi:hypothetical protein
MSMEQKHLGAREELRGADAVRVALRVARAFAETTLRDPAEALLLDYMLAQPRIFSEVLNFLGGGVEHSRRTLDRMGEDGLVHVLRGGVAPMYGCSGEGLMALICAGQRLHEALGTGGDGDAQGDGGPSA